MLTSLLFLMISVAGDPTAPVGPDPVETAGTLSAVAGPAVPALAEDEHAVDFSEMTIGEKLIKIYGHLEAHKYHEEPYAKIGPIHLYGTNHHAAILAAVLLVFLAFGWLANRRRRSAMPRGAGQNLLESLVLFVRDEMVYKTMGEHHGRRFLPLFLSQFFCILVMNLFGLLPNLDFFRVLHFPTTATANMSVTGGLALVTFSVMLYAGIKEQGLRRYIVGLAPTVDLGSSPGMRMLRVVILMILYPIEFIGLIIKPVALMIRLFANMTGGHLAMLTIYGLIYAFNSFFLAGIGVGFNVFLTFLELLVSGIQAYIFTYLSIIFISASVHPEH